MTIAPTVAIEVATGIGAVGDSFLTLNDPVRGELNEALYPLFNPVGPDIITDVAAGAFAYSIRRGRTNELEDVSTGTLAVDLRNYTGTYQFDGTDGFDRGRRVRVLLDGVSVFDGVIDDWKYDYPVEGNSSASIVAIDALGALAGQSFDEWTTTASDTSADRITAILDRDEVQFPTERRSIDDTGSAPYAADVVTWGSNVLAYLQAVARSDSGLVYVSSDGVLTFQRRRGVTLELLVEFGAPVSISLDEDGNPILDEFGDPILTDVRDGVPFSALRPVSGSEFFYTRVTAQRTVGEVQTASVSTTDAIRTLALPNMLLASDADVAYIVELTLAEYSVQRTRVESFDVKLSALTADQRVAVLALDLGDAVSLTWTPEGTAVPVTFYGYIESIDITGSYDAIAVISFGLSPVDYHPLPAFTLDDAVAGKLDEDRLYF